MSILAGVAMLACLSTPPGNASDAEAVVRQIRTEAPTIVSGRLAIRVYEFEPVPIEVPESLRSKLRRADRLTLEQSLAASRVNRGVTCSGELLFDNTAGIWKYALRDTRDLAAIAAAAHLNQTQSRSLSRSRTVLMGRDYAHYLSQLPGGDGRGLLMIARRPEQSSRILPYHFGIVPDAVLKAPDLTLDDTRCDGDPECRTLRLATSWGSTLVQVDAAKRYRYRRMQNRRADGSVSAEWTASDYRIVSGIWIPFHQEERFRSSTGELDRVRITELETAELNVPIPESEFSIQVEPRGNIMSWLGRQGRTYQVYVPVRVTLSTAPNVQSLIWDAEEEFQNPANR